MNGLERILTSTENAWKQTKATLSENAAYKYSVDVVSGWLYFTPTYALQEAFAGKDADTILKTRLIGMAAHAVAMRPIGLLRNYAAKRWDVTQESSFIDKLKVNILAMAPVQSIVYGSMLVGGMAWSGEWDWKSSAYAWGIGVGLGVLHAFPYGHVQDKMRSFFGVRPAIAALPPPEQNVNAAAE